MDLRCWQRQFQAAVLSANPALAGHATAAGLAIYAQAYRSRLLDVLLDVYPGLVALAGRGYCQALVEHAPPTVSNLRDYGADMADYLRSVAAPAEYVAMATWEWALAQVFVAADTRLATRADLTAWPSADWPQLQLCLIPAWRCLRLPAGLVTWREQYLADMAPDLQFNTATELDWVVWRQGLELQQRQLNAEEADLVHGLQQQATLAELCERLLRYYPAEQVAGRLLGWIELWLQQGWCAQIKPGGLI